MADHRTIWYIHPYAGGPGVGRYDRPYHLTRHWQRQGYRCVVLTASSHHLLDRPRQAGPADIEGVPYEFVHAPAYSGNGFGRIANMAAFTARLALQAPDLVRRYGVPGMVIASSPHPYAFLAARTIARRFGARSVFEVRDLWPLSLTELAGVSPRHPLVWFTGWIERHAYRSADWVVSLLPCTGAHMQARGLDIARWRYIPNGIEPEDQSASQEESAPLALARQWRAEGRATLVYAGAMGRPNHLDSLVRAMRLQRHKGRNVGAIIVGRGEMKAQIEQLVVELDLQGEVALFDQIPKQAVIQVLREATVGYISLRPEPLFRFGISPNKLFDYMLASLPVIFAVKAGNDPVAEAGCGVSVDPGDPEGIADAIDAIVSRPPAELEEMGRRAREYVIERHSYEALSREYIGLI